MIEHHEVKNPDGHERKGNWRKWLGAVITAIGFIWLAKKAGWIPVHDGGSALFWPAVVIAIGVLLVMTNRHRKNKRQV